MLYIDKPASSQGVMWVGSITALPAQASDASPVTPPSDGQGRDNLDFQFIIFYFLFNRLQPRCLK